MIYDKRNRENINKLAHNTKLKASEFYAFCIRNNINILIYETIRTKEKQREYVNNGSSQTMKSYHLVGQALDFVPVDNKGVTLWNGYNSPDIKKAINYARQLGFTWGGDWTKFVDKPHLQYEYNGYGTDTFTETKHSEQITFDIEALVQKTLRGEFGNGETRKKKLGSNYEMVQNIINGNKTNTVDINSLVQKTLRGEFGNGETRKKKLGSHYNEVQNIINKKYS